MTHLKKIVVRNSKIVKSNYRKTFIIILLVLIIFLLYIVKFNKNINVDRKSFFSCFDNVKNRQMPYSFDIYVDKRIDFF